MPGSRTGQNFLIPQNKFCKDRMMYWLPELRKNPNPASVCILERSRTPVLFAKEPHLFWTPFRMPCVCPALGVHVGGPAVLCWVSSPPAPLPCHVSSSDGLKHNRWQLGSAWGPRREPGPLCKPLALGAAWRPVGELAAVWRSSGLIMWPGGEQQAQGAGLQGARHVGGGCCLPCTGFQASLPVAPSVTPK